MFGPIMELQTGELTIRLAPLKREDMSEYVTNGGMQSRVVTRYLGRPNAPVLEDEYEYFDHLRQQKDAFSWGIYVLMEEGTWKLIGTTALHDIESKGGLTTATSGFMIFRPEYWGKGIAGHAHRARTLYAYDELNLAQVRSCVIEPNEGSWRALQSVGYTEVSRMRNQAFRDGKWLHHINLEQINPRKGAWDEWWHGDEIPAEFRAARKRTQAALAWAREHVRFA